MASSRLGPGHLPLLHQPADEAGRARGVGLRAGTPPGGAAARGGRRRRGPRPSAPPSHFSSPTSSASHSGSRSDSKVCRSERSRRAPTRAWWTSSGSSPMRTPASWRRMRMTEAAMAARTTSPAVASSPGFSSTSSARSLARAPRARTTLGMGSTAPAPACVQGGDDGLEERRAGARLQLDLELPEAAGQPPPLVDRHLVVDHLGQAQALGVEQLDAPAAGAQAGRRHQRRAAGVGPHQVGHVGRHGGRRLALERELAAHEGGTVVAVGQLDRPAGAVTGAVAQAGAPPGQAQVGRVVVDGVEAALGQGPDGDPVEHAGEVGQGEAGPRPELRLPLPGRLHRVTRNW